MRLKNIGHPDIWLSAVLLGVLSLPFIFSDLDLILQSYFFRSGWFLAERQPWPALYCLGTLPGLLLSAAGLCALTGAWIWPRLKAYRRAAAIVVLTLVIGPGLLVNVLGKNYWGRPRPRDVTAFTGTQPFHRLFKPGTPGQGKSFPCGHASVGFLFVSLYFISKKRGRKWTWLGGGLAYGTLMGIGRMAQGAHFASDVIWAGGLTYLSAALLHHVILPGENNLNTSAKQTSAPDPRKKILGWIILCLALSLLTTFFLLATPYYKTWSGGLMCAKPLTAVFLRLPALKEEIHIAHRQQKDPVQARAEFQGFGFPKLNLSGELKGEAKGATLTASLSFAFDRITSERSGVVRIFIQPALRVMLEAENLRGNIYLGETGAPGKYGPLRITTLNSRIRFHPLPGSELLGPVHLQSQDGDVSLSLEDVRLLNNTSWKTGSEQGCVSIELAQTKTPAYVMNLHGWTHSGELALTGTISPACTLQLRWDEGKGGTNLSTQGEWKIAGQRVTNHSDKIPPDFDLFFSTASGRINIKLKDR